MRLLEMKMSWLLWIYGKKCVFEDLRFKIEIKCKNLIKLQNRELNV